MTKNDKLVHLNSHRSRSSTNGEAEEWRSLAKHFNERNVELLDKVKEMTERNTDQSAKIDRLVKGVEMLVGEMHAFRTGKKDNAFARIARSDEDPDLLRAEADVALYYPHSGTDIGRQLGFTASQIGLLLGAQGLRWADDGDYQELTRWKEGRTRFWHRDVPMRLHHILAEQEPQEFGITMKSICSMFVVYKTRKGLKS